MRIRNPWMMAMAAVCGPALAQTPPADARPQPDRGTRPGATAQPAEEAKARRERLLKAVRLPKKASEVRAKGVPPAEMKEALDAARSKGVRADEMSDVTDEQGKAIDEHGRIDNFGAFVKSKLNEGLRGRELAAAIRAEHVKRGKGKGPKADKTDKDKADKDKAEKKVKDDEGGKPDDKSKPQGKGKADDKGKDKPKGKP